ncbi:General stress protein 16O [Micromonospora sp. MW-13]|uniref:TraR/DksA family transcriptional regulator n=1 Tax=unclassified Micromonospora TaxID=2617518 RepID=UPI000E446893|nr:MULTISPECIES: TraR/DksA family transcriptional regulator [unclassified Micromonospora]MCX4472423.1 TraR/DksA family transcriptional regulator [Micromonospora sp. NBC_01655]RGC66648.1 General stress protein 16O [Micromonospora sp. MW-13]
MSTEIQGVSDRQWLADLRATLTDEHAAQTARLTELTADTGDPGEAHTRAALIAAARQSRERIADALLRIEEGRYGACERCGAQIPPERLEVVPHARFCVPCQQKHGG